MKKSDISIGIIILLLLLALGAVGYSAYSWFISSSSFYQQQSGSDSAEIETGDVSIDIQPLGFSNGQLEFSAVFNTHSVDLIQFDLQKLVTLEYDQQVIRPTSVPSLSGHHASGKISFSLEKNPEKYTVRIQGIPFQLDRIFPGGDS